MKKIIALLAVSVVLSGCQKPEEIVIPADPALWEEQLKPAIQALSESDRDLLAGYLVRSKVEEAWKGGASPIGITVAGAIEKQKAWMEQREQAVAAERARQEDERRLRDEMQTKSKQKEQQMRDAVTITVVKKEINPEWGSSGRILRDENLDISFGYKNNTEKDIRGVKGLIIIKDMFGDVLSEFQVSNDTTIPAGESTVWRGSRSVKYARGNNNDRKFAELPEDAYTVDWNPQMIVFADGTTLGVEK